MTIAINLSGDFNFLTATDTQETYGSGDKVDSGKIVILMRSDPAGAISIAGAGDSIYITAASQEILGVFRSFAGTFDELENKIRAVTKEFYETHVMPFVGKLDYEQVPDFALLIAMRHQGIGKMLNVERTLVSEAHQFDCTGVGSAAANAMLNRLYPRYPTLDSLAVLAAYVIYRVKSSVEWCGLKTEIRFIRQDGIGLVPFDRIAQWETLFKKYDYLQRDVFYHAMNFIVRPPAPPLAMQEAMEKSGHQYDHEQAWPPQMKPLPEIVKDIEATSAEFSHLTIF